MKVVNHCCARGIILWLLLYIIYYIHIFISTHIIVAIGFSEVHISTSSLSQNVLLSILERSIAKVQQHRKKELNLINLVVFFASWRYRDIQFQYKVYALIQWHNTLHKFSTSSTVYGINACKLSQPKNCPIFDLINIKLS